jgi:dTDP-4-amino-4,6-dideoxygalactose transaminase
VTTCFALSSSAAFRPPRHPPIHLEPLYLTRYGRVSLPVTEEVAARSLFIPMFASLSDDDQDRVVEAVVEIVAG